MKVLILGVNGFIGNALAKKILKEKNWEIVGLDLAKDKLGEAIKDPRFHFHQADFLKSWDWTEEQIKDSDVVLPLVAIATPEIYVKNPLRIFELDFEANLGVIRLCVKHKKRVIFPSTSEVYGMCPDPEFDEDNSNLVLGPVPKTRWIYSCSKQLLDRVIWAYGEKEGLPFTLIRPFNWVGPYLDTIDPRREFKSRSLTEFIANLLEGKPIVLVDGGKQKRSFIDIDEGVDCIVKIIEDRGKKTNGQIINIGFPENEYSIEQVAQMAREEFKKLVGNGPSGKLSEVVNENSATAYGKGYQDVQVRKPSIAKAKKLLGWSPHIPLGETVKRTVQFYVEQAAAARK